MIHRISGSFLDLSCIPALLDYPWNEIAAAWHVGAFVADTNQGVTDSKGTQSKDELVETLRQAGQMWENLLHISGGALNLSKCLWSLQYWEWDKGRT